MLLQVPDAWITPITGVSAKRCEEIKHFCILDLHLKLQTPKEQNTHVRKQDLSGY